MLRRSKSGVSTILGALIFVGILFTCVIPLFLYVNQVNSIYDKTMIEKRQFDQEREMERLEVYAFPIGESLNELYVYVRSKCALEVRVVRVWVNEVSHERPVSLSGMSEYTIGTGEGEHIWIDVWEEEDIWIDVCVTTERGNVFASLTNTIHITADGWEPGAYNFGIPIFITAGGQYEVTVKDDLTNPSFQTVVTIKSAPTAYRVIEVPKPGTYYIDVNIIPWTTQIREVTWEIPIAVQVEIPQE